MSLQQLSTETLVHIFDYVGSLYFREDLSRLTVCKWWSRFAHTTCFQDFYITQVQLQRLLASPFLQSNRSLIKASVKTLDLDLRELEDGEFTRRHGSTWGGADHSLACAGCISKLNDDLLYLADITKQSQKLRKLRIRAMGGLEPLLVSTSSGRLDYLFAPTLHAFLSGRKLTSLELDLCGTEVVRRQSHDGEEFHVCPTIATLLPTLRRMRLRLRTICPDVLKPQQHSTAVRLEELLINLSLFNESPYTTSMIHAKSCGGLPFSVLQLRGDMEEQAQNPVAQMTTPKIVRILSHVPPSAEMRAFDVLTGRSIALSTGAEWDDNGEVIADEVSDTESEISDLSWGDE